MLSTTPTPSSTPPQLGTASPGTHTPAQAPSADALEGHRLEANHLLDPADTAFARLAPGWPTDPARVGS